MLSLLVICTLTDRAERALAQPPSPSWQVNPRAVRFVTDIVLDDFHTAQAGGGYVFSYDRQETDDTLTVKLARWFSGTDARAIAMEPPEKQALFGFYWAASMMPANSPCFSGMVNDACQNELSLWMAREADDDPRFVTAYEAARPALGLPTIGANGR
ncbi:hypothetical protein [Caballeronia sp. BR00000012568055]|uniref:hypothetical protein n=1 Tax=Caballeronia sp. BR00000012568055 TaxID=2918761 RepID=UPI0023F84586|nr:hypothetical protein [Caballeronia sp. BR00000012568055]